MINGKIHYKWSFSIAMLVYQRVAFSNLRDLRELAMPCHEPFLYLVGGDWNHGIL